MAEVKVPLRYSHTHILWKSENLHSVPFSDDLPPGSACAVASNLLKSLATQFADRRLFLFLFNYQYTATMAEEVFASLGTSLPAPPPQGEGEGEGPEEDDEGITVVSPVTYFLQVQKYLFSYDP